MIHVWRGLGLERVGNRGSQSDQRPLERNPKNSKLTLANALKRRKRRIDKSSLVYSLTLDRLKEWR